MHINKKKMVFWLLLGGAPPLAVSVVCIMLAFLLLVMLAAFSSALFGNGVQFGGQGSNPLPVIQGQQWKGQENRAVVSAALSLAPLLFACGEEQHTQCYTAMPQSLLSYWSGFCPAGSGCFPYWQSGDFQCVTFVTGAYHLAGQDLPSAPDARYFWTDRAYTRANGWEHISNTSMPYPGDIIVMTGPTLNAAGHVAIVTDVATPTSARAGFVQFAQGNALVGVATEPLMKTSSGDSMQIWAGYSILGYLRHIVNVS
jgi:hypothetical protein